MDLAVGLSRPDYQDRVLAMRPVLYLPLQGSKVRELVRAVAPTVVNTESQGGPFQGTGARRFANNAHIVTATHASYHPGNTLSVGGWFNRLGAGDAGAGGGSVLYTCGTGDFTVWFPTGTNAGRLVFRKSGTGDVFASAASDWGAPYTKGWHHVICTKTGSTTKMYINGIDDAGGGTTADQTIVASSVDPTIGRNVSPHNNLEFDGQMAHWAVWDRVLAGREAEYLYLYGLRTT